MRGFDPTDPLLHLSPHEAEPIQHYPKTNAIKIGIADTGIGIFKSISHVHQVDFDLAAIRLALQPGVTGTTSHEGGTSQNAGAGLFFIKSAKPLLRRFVSAVSLNFITRGLHDYSPSF